MKKRLISLVLTTVLLLSIAIPAMAVAPKTESVEYDGGRIVEVNFSGKVSYRNPKVTVKDSAGKTLTARIVERDRDDLEFSVTGLKSGSKYTFTITGVRAGFTGSYGTVKGSFRVPAKAGIRKVKYDAEDRELDARTGELLEWERD